MEVYKKIAILMIVIQAFVLFAPSVYAAENEESSTNAETSQRCVEEILNFLQLEQSSEGSWGKYGKKYTSDITNILEYVYFNTDTYMKEVSDTIDLMLYNAEDYIWIESGNSIDDLSKYLLIDGLRIQEDIQDLISLQNPDGGFGLAEGYTSDIVDTKLALKALADLGETEAMANAAGYIVSKQNEDGGFGYQEGLASNPELTAEIADILADCMKGNEALAYTLSDTMDKVGEYLDKHKVGIDELSSDDLSAVYQHFHTALFELKTSGKYDVTPYFDLQDEDGGIFDDPMATALFLELIVCEQNSLVANLDYITITNDQGKTVSAFGENEYVNIAVGNEYETEKAYLKVTIEKPDGESISLDSEKLIWNTGDAEEGEYTVKAEIVRKANDETVTSMTQSFRIEHRLSVDHVLVRLSQDFTRVGDEAKVDVLADIHLKNFSEETEKLSIQWKVKDNDEVIQTDKKEITDEDLEEDTISLGQFIPDTSERKTYLITAEILSGELVLAQSTTNFFVSDKSVAVVRDVDKEFLYETTDDAEITAKIRDERVVDLIFTTSSDDTKLISSYAERIEEIKNELEQLGYVVNVCSVSTSYLSAKDTFAWDEYDHPNYNTQSPYTKHIVYEDDNIKMLGYTYSPYKDFLLVPDDNASQKIFNFDIQRDQTDWHSMNGGGFLFNTVIEENKISGYYVLITYAGLRLYSLDNISLERFRNSSTVGTLLKTFSFSDVYDEHHIKIVADSNTLSLWDGEKQVIDNYELPEIYGNGYGPITSHSSHNCWQRSYFTFANITMQTITGEKLSDILENYNFESQTSRYVINLSDNLMENLDTEEEVEEIAQKIKDKNISFVGLGNEKNKEQYQSLMDSITEQGQYYDFTLESTPDGLKNEIIQTEEDKRVKIDDEIIATDLVLTGTLYGGEEFKQTFESLAVGETLEAKIPMELTGLTAGTDAVLLTDAILTYKDENGISRTKKIADVTLPVLTPEGKIKNQVSTDKAEYSSYEDVKIFDRVHNYSKDRTAKNLTNVITILNENGEIIAEYKADLAEIMSSGYVECQEIWNTENLADGVYTIRSEIYAQDKIVSQSTTEITVTAPELPEIKLKGELNLSGKTFKPDDTIVIDSKVENVGRIDVENAQMFIKILNGKDGTIVYQYEEPLNLEISQARIKDISVTPQTDFTSKKSGEYLIIYEAVTEDGRTIPLAGDGFVLDGGIAELFGDKVLFSMNTTNQQKGILMNGWMITVDGGIHSNSSIESNCSIVNISDSCDSVEKPIFNTWITQIENGIQKAEVKKVPDYLPDIHEQLDNTEVSIDGGWIDTTEKQLRIYGNNVTTDKDIYSEKTIVIDPSNFSSNKGILICGEEDIIIRSTDVEFKGIIYAPNGTVKIESSNFKLKGRIIAKNIIYQGSTFKGETYDNDLELLEKYIK